MRSPCRWSTLALLASIAACKPSRDERVVEPAAAPASRRVGTETSLRLVVLISIDQLPSWGFDPLVPSLRDGLRRIVEGGVYWPRAAHPYAATFTAPGHATLSTGAPPAVTGIVGNRWYERAKKKLQEAGDDDDAKVFALAGDPSRAGHGVSGAQMLVDGLADTLRARTGGAARSVAVGLKSRATIFVAGRRPDLAVWYEPSQSAMTTSSAYVASPPAWLVEMHRAHPVAERFDDVWEPLDPRLLARLTGSEDQGLGEGEEDGFDNTFPHVAAQTPNPASSFRLMPWANDVVVDTAVAAVIGEQLGRDDVADLLCVTFSAHDYAGHMWGQESWERVDMLLRLDRSLGRLFDAFDREVGVGRWAVLLSSDHGAAPLVERSLAAGRAAHRIGLSDIHRVAESAAKTVLGPGTWVAGVSPVDLYVTDALLAQDAEKRERALDAMVARVAAIEGMAWAGRTDRVAGDCTARRGIEALVCRSLNVGRSGEIAFAPAPLSVASEEHPTGTAHGSPSPEDREVPIVLYAPGIPPEVAREVVSTLRIAPTIAALLGISSPPAATEPSL
jgi:hypothetical protein